MTKGFDITEIHHLAIVVDHIDGSMSRYSKALGLTWAEPWTGAIPIVIGNERFEPVVSFTLSLQGPPHLELIQTTAHRAWLPGPGIHHFGLWSDDFDSDTEAMMRNGLAVEVMSPTADFAYLTSADGARIELVNGRSRPDFARWLSGGQL